MSTDVVMSCKKAGIDVKLRLLDEQAPKLCGEIKKMLPLTTLYWHAVISGDNAGFFLPIIWTDFENPQEREKGDVFLYANGQLVVICYEKNTEPGRVNKFAEIKEESLENMKKLGQTLEKAIMMGEDPYFIELYELVP